MKILILRAKNFCIRPANRTGYYKLQEPLTLLEDFQSWAYLSTIEQSCSCTTLASILSSFIGKQLSQAGTTWEECMDQFGILSTSQANSEN